ncbi:3-phosphoshikimate 1-carboxyvinyltransferase [Taibaiella lutea]|uniref:3-phosphoshikimate 1-carboxyvinyltransferase n=1 Tax=Taibaiella lutea TaxID=2608001 RepID=A0A5M6CI05_9BACT|nr:3-phosphoshikimate 1-carboxyvinyltransferase [Taibaiella lutea]KAA5534744.1 3-phosphoshikimate 1-carboxyvinyltransferase [Taibaiella lutea]
MQITINPTLIKGTIHAPASKSVMQRACAAALLRNGITIIDNYGQSNDDKAAINIIQQLGAKVTYTDAQKLEITSDGLPKVSSFSMIDCAESGLSLRMFAPIAALLNTEVTFVGHGSLLKRPVHFIEAFLSGLGVTVFSNEGLLPLEIKGPLKPVNCNVDGSITSQLLTGILFAFGTSAKEDVSIEVDNLKSKPYIDLTLKVMEDFGMNVPVNDQYQRFIFKYKPSDSIVKKTLNYTIEGDWSSAAFFMVAGAIAGNVIIKGLDVFTTQADKKVLEALQDCGCRLSIQMEQIEVTKHELKAFHFDATDCPDLFPPLVALAAHCNGTSVIEGVHRLEHKESNRTLSLQAEFEKLGVHITIQDDKMIIVRQTKISEPLTLNGHNDHRIVMACAIAALVAKAPVAIDGIEAVNKSYPDFFRHLMSIQK